MTHEVTLLRDICLKIDVEIGSIQKIPYASDIGFIMYAMLCTRSNVSYALTVYGEGHWIDVKNILKYLRKTKELFILGLCRT